MLNNKFIIISIVFLFVFSLLVGGELPFFLFYFVLAIFLLSFIEVLYYMHNTKTTLTLKEMAIYAGDKIEIYYEIHNNSHFSIPYVEIDSIIERKLTNDYVPPIIYSVEPKQTISTKTSITAKRRGFYSIGEIKIGIRDSLGIFKLNKSIKENTSIVIYPYYRKLDSFQVFSGLSSGELPIYDKIIEDRSRNYGVRKYTVGDPVKSIHWKMSAKKNVLMTKEYENRADTSVIIIIDSYIEKFKKDLSHHIEDTQVEVASSIIDYCLNHEIHTSLFFENENENMFIQGNSQDSFKSFMDELAKYSPKSSLDFSHYLDYIYPSLYEYSTIVCITPFLNKEDAKEIINLKMKGFNPIVIHITDIQNKNYKINYSYIEKLKSESISVYEIDYRSNRARNLEA
jgi:uncharacterized protein (DUF58 family)